MTHFIEQYSDNHSLLIDFELHDIDESINQVEITFNDLNVEINFFDKNKNIIKSDTFVPQKYYTPKHYTDLQIKHLNMIGDVVINCEEKSNIKSFTLKKSNINGKVDLFTGERLYLLHIRYSKCTRFNFNAFKINKISFLEGIVGFLYYVKSKENNPSNAYILETIDVLGKSFIGMMKYMVTELLYISHSGYHVSHVGFAYIIAHDHYFEGDSTCQHLGVTVEHSLDTDEIKNFLSVYTI